MNKCDTTILIKAKSQAYIFTIYPLKEQLHIISSSS